AGLIADARRVGGHAAPHRQVEDLLGDLGQAVERGAAARAHDAGVQRVAAAGLANLVPPQVAYLLGPRLEDLREDAPGHQARTAPAHAGDLHRLVLTHECVERAAAPALQLLGVGHGRPQADGDVIGEVVAAYGDNARVPEAAALEDREVGGAAAVVAKRHAQLALVGRQHRLGRRDLLEHGIDDGDAGAVDARDEVLHRRRAPRDDVDVHVEPGAGHAHR